MLKAGTVKLLASVTRSKAFQAVGTVTGLPEAGAAAAAEGFSPPLQVSWVVLPGLSGSGSGKGVGVTYVTLREELHDLGGTELEAVCRARNMQEISSVVGQYVEGALHELAAQAPSERVGGRAQGGAGVVEIDERDEAFFEDARAAQAPEGMDAGAARAVQEEVWSSLKAEIEGRLGRVLFAGFVGSRRYNLAVESSDWDYWCVYQAPSRQVMSGVLDAPRDCVKNPSSVKPDLTVLEVGAFVRMLASGDPRCVEALFAPDETVLHEDALWQTLKAQAPALLSIQVAEKYYSDATGAKGLKYWRRKHKADADEIVVAKKMAIVCRQMELAQRVLDVLSRSTTGFSCRFDTTSDPGSFLLKGRRGEYPFEVIDARAIELERSVREGLEEARRGMDSTSLSADAVRGLEAWLYGVRVADQERRVAGSPKRAALPGLSALSETSRSSIVESVLRAARTAVAALARRSGYCVLYAAVLGLRRLEAMEAAGTSAEACRDAARRAVWQIDVVYAHAASTFVCSFLRSEYLKMRGSHHSQAGTETFDADLSAQVGALAHRDSEEVVYPEHATLTEGPFTFATWAHEAASYASLLLANQPRVFSAFRNDDDRIVLLASGEWLELVSPDFAPEPTEAFCKKLIGMPFGLLSELRFKSSLSDEERRRRGADLVSLLCHAQTVLSDILVKAMNRERDSGAAGGAGGPAASTESPLPDVIPWFSEEDEWIALRDGIDVVASVPRIDAVRSGLETVRKAIVKRKAVAANASAAKSTLRRWVTMLRASALPPPTSDISNWQDLPAGIVSKLAHIGIDLDPQSLLFVVRSGSFMYNLHTETSDEDYAVIFLRQSHMVYTFQPPKNRIAKHVHKEFAADKSDDVEFSAVELEVFLTDLMKGNPRNIELLYTNSAVFQSDLFSELRRERRRFITGRCVDQYLGQIADRLWRVRKLQEVDTPEEQRNAQSSKLFYHAFHKIGELERIVARQDIAVAADGAERDFIMRIRQGPLAGDFAVERLLEQAQSRLEAARAIDAERCAEEAAAGTPRPQEVDLRWVHDWMEGVRLRFA